MTDTRLKRFRPVTTPIVEDMQRTARELDIVELLLEHQRIVYSQTAHAYDLVEEVLVRLGVSNEELFENIRYRSK